MYLMLKISILSLINSVYSNNINDINDNKQISLFFPCKIPNYNLDNNIFDNYFKFMQSIFILSSGFFILAYIIENSQKISKEEFDNNLSLIINKNKRLYNYGKSKGFYDGFEIQAFLDAIPT